MYKELEQINGLDINIVSEVKQLGREYQYCFIENEKGKTIAKYSALTISSNG